MIAATRTASSTGVIRCCGSTFRPPERRSVEICCRSSELWQIKPYMGKGERISQFVRDLEGDDVDLGGDVANRAFYRAYFRCWNEQRYYEAHDVLEQLWLNSETVDDNFFKGLIQAAGAFVHLQKNFEHPTHAKHSHRLGQKVKIIKGTVTVLSILAGRFSVLEISSLIVGKSR